MPTSHATSFSPAAQVVGVGLLPEMAKPLAPQDEDAPGSGAGAAQGADAESSPESMPTAGAVKTRISTISARVRSLLRTTAAALTGTASDQSFGTYGVRDALANPVHSYAAARDKVAAAHGVAPEQVGFVEATASLSEPGGSRWRYTFAVAGTKGGPALVYADQSRSLGGEEFRISTHKGASVPSGMAATAIDAASFAAAVGDLDPENALELARKALPDMSGGISVSFSYIDGHPWYRFFSDKGEVVSVNARNKEARVDAPISAARRSRTIGWY